MRRLPRVVLAVSLVIAGLASLSAPRIAMACSCISWDLREQVANGAAILEGTVAGREGDGVRILVDRWYAGPGRAPQVTMAGDFDRPGVSSSCSVGAPPAAGSRWIWVAWRSDETGDFSIVNCSPFEQLFGGSNQLRDQVVLAYGEGWSPPSFVVAPEPEGVDLTMIAAAAVVVTGIAMLVGVVFLARRRTD